MCAQVNGEPLLTDVQKLALAQAVLSGHHNNTEAGGQGSHTPQCMVARTRHCICSPLSLLTVACTICAAQVGAVLAAVLVAKVPRHVEAITSMATNLNAHPDPNWKPPGDDPKGVLKFQVRISRQRTGPDHTHRSRIDLIVPSLPP